MFLLPLHYSDGASTLYTYFVNTSNQGIVATFRHGVNLVTALKIDTFASVKDFLNFEAFNTFLPPAKFSHV